MPTLRDLGKWLVASAPFLDWVARSTYARLPATWHDTPTARLKLFYTDRPSITFLQIGAYDGVAGDPLRPIVEHDARWRGVLVEPQTKPFERLQYNYSGAAGRLKFLNCAIATAPGKLAFYFVPPDAIERNGLPSWYAELASFDRANIETHAPKAPIERTIVRTLTVAGALAEANLSRVDCIVMDVEGFEAVLLPSIDYDQLGVSFVIFEHKHLETADRHTIDQRLASFGFSIKHFGRDTIAWRTIASALPKLRS